MTDTNDILGTDKDSSNRAYNAARADWHRHRAASAIDGTTRTLHEKFALLYDARAEADYSSAVQPAEF